MLTNLTDINNHLLNFITVTTLKNFYITSKQINISINQSIYYKRLSDLTNVYINGYFHLIKLLFNNAKYVLTN